MLSQRLVKVRVLLPIQEATRNKKPTRNKCIASSNKCLTSSNRCLTCSNKDATSNKKLLGTSARHRETLE